MDTQYLARELQNIARNIRDEKSLDKMKYLLDNYITNSALRSPEIYNLFYSIMTALKPHDQPTLLYK